MILTAVLAVVLLVSLALFWMQGAWSNVINFFNLVFAGLVASSFFEVVATKVEEQQMSGMRYITDFLAWWILFAVAFTVFRILTDMISPHQVEFVELAEKITCGVMSFVNAWVLVCMVSASFHMAPLNQRPFQDADLDSPSFLGLSPDRMWLGFVGHQSRTIMSGSEEFDADSFISSHQTRRADFEAFDGYQASAEE